MGIQGAPRRNWAAWAAARLGALKTPSRTSGAWLLTWMATNTPTSATPTSPATTVDADVQPACGARTTAKTMEPGPRVTLVAPATSTEPRRAAPAGITDRVSSTTAAARGTLMKNT